MTHQVVRRVPPAISEEPESAGVDRSRRLVALLRLIDGHARSPSGPARGRISSTGRDAAR
jgi:hypothetical protein